MTHSNLPKSSVVIACGGTGGHLFPGIAVAEECRRRNCQVTLLVSSKEIDQRAVKTISDATLRVVSLPAVGLERRAILAFLRGLLRAYSASARLFRSAPPDFLLTMGGFTGAAPLLAARRLGARTFLHESNVIPGRANRWLSRFVDRAFVAFPPARKGLRCPELLVTGTPVRPGLLTPLPPGARQTLGLQPLGPVGLVMGGSQGASGVNSAIIGALPRLRTTLPDWQWLHLAGAGEEAKVREAYRANGLRAAVHAFLDEMDLALGVSSVAVTRAGGSTLAELAALRLPAVLIPFPAATDNHQWHNARAFETIGAGRLVSQSAADPATLVNSIAELACNASTREAMQSALGRWHKADSAARITEAMLELAPQPNRVPSSSGSPFGSTPSHHPSVIA